MGGKSTASTHELSVRTEALEAAMTDVAAIVSEASARREKRTRGSFRVGESKHLYSQAGTQKQGAERERIQRKGFSAKLSTVSADRGKSTGGVSACKM